jgi:hypothetical protein
MTRKRLRCFYFLLAILLPSMAAGADFQILGSAYDLSGGEFLYSEHHRCTRDNLHCSVDYRDGVGDLIAQKKLDFSDSPHGPALLMQDYRRAVEFELSSDNRDDLVIDAGFDNFLRSKWSALEGGETVNFSFLVLGVEEPLMMQATMDDSSSCPVQQLCLVVNLDSWLLGLLVDPIQLSYSRDDQKLLRYEGPSNLQGEGGESLDVVIHYEYGNLLFPVERQARPENVQFNF